MDTNPRGLGQSQALLEEMPENYADAAAWLQRLNPDALDRVWVASAVQFAVEGIGPLCAVLNAVRERVRVEGTVLPIPPREPEPAPAHVPKGIKIDDAGSIMGECAHCGRGFVRGRRGTRFCSHICRARASRARANAKARVA